MTVLGLGGMGRALAGAFLDAGHPTTVWNRSPGRDAELVRRGALRAPDAAAAARAVGLVIVCVLDYDGAWQIVEPLGDDLRDRALVNLTSDTPERAREFARWADGRGVGYLDGAVGGLGMMAVSVDHVLHAARDRGLDVAQLTAIKVVADRAVAQGHGGDDWGSTVEAIRPAGA